MNGKCFTRRHVEPAIRHFGRTALGDLITAEVFPARAGGMRLLLWVGARMLFTGSFANQESALSYAKTKATVLRKTRKIEIGQERQEKSVQTTGQLPMFAEAV